MTGESFLNLYLRHQTNHRIMKHILTCFLLILTISGYSQTEPNKAAELVTKDVKFPTRKQAGKKELIGKYTFVVELDGSLSNVQVKDSIGFGIDEQIVKRLSQLNNFKVPEIAGTPTRVSFSLPIGVPLKKK